MAGNSFGQIFKITTFGESHGAGVGVVIDGCPPEIPLTPKDFVYDMARRRPGKHRLESPRKEKDQVNILSGVFQDMTTGTPITLFIQNGDVDSRPYSVLQEVFRPGHADFSYFKKYGHFDFRGGGRYSARETAARVAAGVVAGKILKPLGIEVVAYTVELGGIKAAHKDLKGIGGNILYCPDPAAAKLMEEAVSRAKKDGDSLGGIAEIKATGCPAGLGEPVFDKLDAELAKALMSIGAVKGVEIGVGFEAARLRGSENNDPIDPEGFRSNNAGGILGGISNGDEILVRVATKPIPSIPLKQDTVDRKGRSAKLEFASRSDVSAIPRVIPILEAMVKVVLVDHILRSRAVTSPFSRR